jgi:hypothetical protein
LAGDFLLEGFGSEGAFSAAFSFNDLVNMPLSVEAVEDVVWVEALSMVVVDLVDLKDLGDMLTGLCSLEDSVFVYWFCFA